MYRPEMYVKLRRTMHTSYEEIIEEFSEQLGRMSGRCIDIGTGPGDHVVDSILPKLHPNSTLLCTDISEPMLNYAKKTYGDDERLSFMKLDIGTPELSKDLVEQFDHAVSIHCIHWCKDHRQALKNIHSLLRPGGTAFLIYVANYPCLDAFMVLEAMPQYKPYMRKIHHIVLPYQNVARPRQDEMTLLKDIGFEIEVCSCRPITWTFETVDSTKEFLLAIGPLEIDDMPADLQEAYINDLTREFMNRGIIINKNENNKDDYGVLSHYRMFILTVKKLADK